MKRAGSLSFESIHRLQPCAMINMLTGETTDGPSPPVPPEPTKPAKPTVLQAALPAIQQQTYNITRSSTTATTPIIAASLLQRADQLAHSLIDHAQLLQTMHRPADLRTRPHRTTLELLHKPLITTAMARRRVVCVGRLQQKGKQRP